MKKIQHSIPLSKKSHAFIKVVFKLLLVDVTIKRIKAPTRKVKWMLPIINE